MEPNLTANNSASWTTPLLVLLSSTDSVAAAPGVDKFEALSEGYKNQAPAS